MSHAYSYHPERNERKGYGFELMGKGVFGLAAILFICGAFAYPIIMSDPGSHTKDSAVPTPQPGIVLALADLPVGDQLCLSFTKAHEHGVLTDKKTRIQLYFSTGWDPSEFLINSVEANGTKKNLMPKDLPKSLRLNTSKVLLGYKNQAVFCDPKNFAVAYLGVW